MSQGKGITGTENDKTKVCEREAMVLLGIWTNIVWLQYREPERDY